MRLGVDVEIPLAGQEIVGLRAGEDDGSANGRGVRDHDDRRRVGAGRGRTMQVRRDSGPGEAGVGRPVDQDLLGGFQFAGEHAVTGFGIGRDLIGPGERRGEMDDLGSSGARGQQGDHRQCSGGGLQAHGLAP